MPRGGEITLTATDKGGATGEHKTVKVTVTDQNLEIGEKAVTIDGQRSERVWMLTARFR